MRHNIFSFLLIFISSVSAFVAQTASAQDESIPVVVSVYVRGTGKPIKRAEVRIGNDVFYTDKDAKVTLNIPRSGEGKILITRFGFDKKFIEFSAVRPNSTYDVYLLPAAPSDNEVFVRGEKRPEVSKKTISVEESRRVAPNDDPAQVVKLMPGVQAADFGNEISVRGSGPEDSRYYIDNMRTTMIFHAIGDLSILPEQLISDVEFYAGGFGAQYGDATGGIIVLRTKTNLPEEPRTTFNLNVPFYSAVFHERPLSEDSSLAVSARYSYLQYILPLFIPKSAGLTVVPYFADMHAFYLLKDKDGSGHTKLIALGAQDGIKLVFNYEESDSDDGKGSIDYKRSFATVGVERLKNLGDGWSTTVTPQIIYDKSDAMFFNDQVNWDYYEGRVHAELNRRLSKKENFYLGVEPIYGVFKAHIVAPIESDDPLYDYEDAERRTVHEDIPYRQAAAWSSIDQQFGPFIITPGLRGYYDAQIKEAGVDPRLAARYEINDANTLKASVGLYSSSPSPQESNNIFGNPDLTFERSVHYVLGLETRWADRWETDVQLYYKNFYDVVIPEGDKVYTNHGRARSRGAEVFIRRNLTDRAFGWLSYTYSRTDENNNDGEGWHDSEYDQTHVGQVVGSYKLTSWWDIGSRFKYHTGDTYTPVKDAVYNASLDKYQPRSSEADKNKKRLSDYHQIDLFMTNDLLLRTWKLSFRYGIQYLAFNKPVFGKSYNYDYSKEKDFNSIPPIPFFELKGEF